MSLIGKTKSSKFKSRMNCGHTEEQVFVTYCFKSGFSYHSWKFSLFGKSPDALHEVLVWMPVSGNNLTHGWYNLKRIFVVYPVKKETSLQVGAIRNFYLIGIGIRMMHTYIHEYTSKRVLPTERINVLQILKIKQLYQRSTGFGTWLNSKHMKRPPGFNIL